MYKVVPLVTCKYAIADRATLVSDVLTGASFWLVFMQA